MLSCTSRLLRQRPKGALYLVPDRSTPRASFVPAGRALHLVDLENLMGGSFDDRALIDDAITRYCEAASIQMADHVFLAVNPAIAMAVGKAWPKARLRTGRGRDGADLALLTEMEDREWIAERYDRVIIGSGDGIFQQLAYDLRARGIAVGVVSQECRLSRGLRQAATYVRPIDLHEELENAA